MKKNSKIQFLFYLFVLGMCVLFGTVYASDIVLQPGPDIGKDAGAYDYEVPWASGDTAHTWIWNSDCNGCSGIGYLQFDVTGLPAENIVSAEIQTYNIVYFNGAGSPWEIDPIIAVRRVTSNWDETTLGWSNQPSYNPVILDSNLINTVGGGSTGTSYTEFEGWLSYNVTDLCKAWVAGEPNHGVRFSVENPTCINGDEIGYLTSDYTTDISRRPKLIIKHDVKNFTGSPRSGTAPLNVQFNDTSTDAGITGYTWIFSDNPGTVFTDRNLTHTFATSGTYDVNHSVTNSEGTVWTNETGYITVMGLPVPVASFSGTPRSGTAPLEVQFTDTSTGIGITEWQWFFGDGTTSTTQSPTHIFDTSGSYNVNHSVTNTEGTTWMNRTGYITVTGLPVPVTSFTGSPRRGTAPLEVQFNDTSTGTGITGWQWIFSDSPDIFTTQNLTHTFTNPGAYYVNHAVTNSAGTVWKNETRYINVTEPAPVADFTGTPNSGTAPHTVQFSDTSENSPTGWAWYFGDDNWTTPWTQQTASAAWSARDSQSSVVMPDGSIILMGGYDGSIFKNDVWRSTDNGVTWDQQTANAGWTARFAHRSVVMPDGSIILMGGWTSGGTNKKNDVWKSTDSGVTWTLQTANAAWSARDSQSSVVLPDGSIILMGGWASDGLKNDTWLSADNGTTWTQQSASAGWSARWAHSSVVMPDGSIILMGGQDSGVNNDVWRSMDKGVTWTRISTSAAWSARMSHSSVVVPDGSIVLTGGYPYKNDAWRSADNGTTWTQVTRSAGWSARNQHSSVAMPDGSIILIGGDDGAVKKDVWRFVPTGSSAQNPSHTYTMPGTYQVALQSYNNAGYNSTRKTGYISVSAPPAPVATFTGTPTTGIAPLPVSFTGSATNSPTGWAWFFGDEDYKAPWTQQSPSPGWAQRGYHNSVVMPDGSIILMGGYTGSINLNDTWRSTDNGVTWTQQTAGAGWMGRRAQSSVAMPDGSIILMGGWNGVTQFNDVWKSVNNGVTWTLQTASAGWAVRRGHSSVVMPDGSIVLTGGQDSSGLKNDTWRSTDKGTTWTQQSASAGWSARYYHSSLVMPDGSIVLMGGSGRNDIWRSADNGVTWTLQTASAGWAGRQAQSSVVMPDGSIVLMGGTPSTNDTWRSTDNGATWTRVNASAGWSARYAHASVAMPDGSIVLTGGYSGSSYKTDTWRVVPVGSTEQNPSHTYTMTGIYPVALQVFNTGGYNSLRKTSYITVTGPPVAGFTAARTRGTVPLTVTFTDTSLNTPTSWDWSFGDGNTSTLQNPVHTYDYPGTFTVNLTATNAVGSDTSVRTNYIVVTDPKPIPGFTASMTSGFAPLPVSFTDLSLNRPTGWAWFFGDETYTAPWTRLNASSGWTARLYHSSVVMPDGTIVLMGGQDSSGYKNDVWRSVDNGTTWTLQTASAGWSARYRQTSVAMPDGSIVLMGGWNGTSKNDTWRSTDYGVTWTQQTASAGWPARSYYSSVAMPDGSIVLMGGSGSNRWYNDTWRSTDNGTTWTNVNASAGWSARFGHTSVAMPDGSIVLMGGSAGEIPYHDVWRSIDNGATWTQQTASAGWAARNSYSSVAMPDGSIVLMGGSSSSYTNDVWRSADNGVTWTQLTANAGWTARVAHSSMAMPDGSIVLAGGSGGGSGNYKNDTWRFVPTGSSAQHPSHTYTLPGTYQVTLQAYNAGGYNSTRKISYITILPMVAAFNGTPLIGLTPLNVDFTDASLGNPTGWAWYFGDENWTVPAWTQQTASAGWAGRSGHSSVAMPDGSIILMGGYDGWGHGKNDVWRSTNNGATWTQQTASAGWAARSVHSSVAMPDGSIILMGGYDGSIFYNDVWRSTNNGATWTQQTTSAGWSRRFGHTSVAMADGSIILMGGYSSGYKNDVWRSMDNGVTWTNVKTSAGWSARYTHNSVAMADGSIVLMGGEDGSYRNDVWRSTDKGTNWTQQTASAGWTARISPSSVAMPDDSIILMGGYSSGYKNDVWRSMDDGRTWTNVNTSAEWFARYGHTSVAMPDGSIVLMGGLGGGERNDVWRFVPTGSSLQNPSHTYTTQGTYPVALQVFNTNGYNSTRKTGYITVTGSNFTADVTAGIAPLAVTFTDLSTHTPTSWAWSFGDGTTSGLQNPVHTYVVSGTYTVTLTATNAVGSNTAVRTDYIVVTPPKPIADFSADVTSGTAPLPVSFSDRSLNNPTGWAWYFGDETSPVSWTQQTASAGWTTRTGHTSVALPDGSIVLMGGEDGSYRNDVWRSTDKGTNWTQQTDAASWTVRSGHTCVALPDGSIVMMGGCRIFWDEGIEEFMNDVWRSTDKGVTWTLQNASPGWAGRYGHTTVALSDGSIVMMGGWGSGWVTTNDVWRSTDKGATWTLQNANAGWSARSGHSSVAMPDSSIILMGGYDGSIFKNDVWRSTDNGAAWTQVNESAKWTARSGHTSVAMPDSSIVLMGGADGVVGLTSDTWQSTDNGATWTQVNESPGWTSRSGLSSVAIPDGSIVMMGGADGVVGFKNDVWRFVPAGSLAQNPFHTYTTPGTYQVALQASNAIGYNITQKAGYITVTGSPSGPVADFTANPRNGTAPLNVLFNDTSTGMGITNYQWIFSDNPATMYTTQNLTHSFTSTGTYNVNHSVTDTTGTTWKNETSYITVATVHPFPKPSGGYFPLPTDPNNDGLFEDLDGNGWIGFNDVVVYYNNMDDIGRNLYGPLSFYDYDHSGFIGFNDVVHLYGMIE